MHLQRYCNPHTIYQRQGQCDDRYISKCGIPVYSNWAPVISGSRSIALSILSVMDNPKQDIPLASVLRSPVVGLSPRDITIIRVFNQHWRSYESLKKFCFAS